MNEKTTIKNEIKQFKRLKKSADLFSYAIGNNESFVDLIMTKLASEMDENHKTNVFSHLLYNIKQK